MFVFSLVVFSPSRVSFAFYEIMYFYRFLYSLPSYISLDSCALSHKPCTHFPLLSVSCLIGPFTWILYFALFPLFNPISLVSLPSSVTLCLLHLDPSPLSHCLLTVVPFFHCPLFLIGFHFFIFHCLLSDNSFLPLNLCPLSHFSFVTTSY